MRNIVRIGIADSSGVSTLQGWFIEGKEPISYISHMIDHPRVITKNIDGQDKCFLVSHALCEKFVSITGIPEKLRSSHVIIVLFDKLCEFENAKEIIKSITFTTNIILVRDAANEDKSGDEAIKSFSQEKKITYFPVNTQTGENINELLAAAITLGQPQPAPSQTTGKNAVDIFFNTFKVGTNSYWKVTQHDNTSLQEIIEHALNGHTIARVGWSSFFGDEKYRGASTKEWFTKNNITLPSKDTWNASINKSTLVRDVERDIIAKLGSSVVNTPKT